MPKALFTRPDFDIATKYLAEYGKLLTNYALTKGYEVTDLYEVSATKINFEFEIGDTDVFLGFGHGNADKLTGQNLEVILQSHLNSNRLSGKKCFLGSCHTGADLGPTMVSETCPEFYGYKEDFTFLYHPDYYANGQYLEDPYAKPFFDSLIVTGYSLLDQKTPAQIYSDQIAAYHKWWDYWITQEDPMADDVLTWLNWNENNYVAITPTSMQSGASETSASLTELAKLAIPVGIVALFLIFNPTK